MKTKWVKIAVKEIYKDLRLICAFLIMALLICPEADKTALYEKIPHFGIYVGLMIGVVLTKFYKP